MRQGFTIPGGLADVRFRIFVDIGTAVPRQPRDVMLYRI
jgi:hypothetical protein